MLKFMKPRREMVQVKDLPKNRRDEYDCVRHQMEDIRKDTNAAMVDYANNRVEEAQAEMRSALNAIDSLIKYQLNDYSYKAL